jgi:hypothetical protein
MLDGAMEDGAMLGRVVNGVKDRGIALSCRGFAPRSGPFKSRGERAGPACFRVRSKPGFGLPGLWSTLASAAVINRPVA